jgi:nicotinamide riboside kinase
MEESIVNPFRIAFTGPECSGKSTLSAWLATLLDIPLVPEFARSYLANSTNYEHDDLHAIANGQFIQNHAHRACVCDTEMTVMRIWEQVKYNAISKSIDELSHLEVFQCLFLCKPDFPWVEDPLREHPTARDYLFSLYLKDLDARKIPYFILEGSLDQRKAKIMSVLNLEHLPLLP